MATRGEIPGNKENKFEKGGKIYKMHILIQRRSRYVTLPW